jgi:hypothetical protein
LLAIKEDEIGEFSIVVKQVLVAIGYDHLIGFVVIVLFNDFFLKNNAQFRFFLMLHSRPLRIVKKDNESPTAAVQLLTAS